jgi:hypothetical protein
MCYKTQSSSILLTGVPSTPGLPGGPRWPAGPGSPVDPWAPGSPGLPCLPAGPRSPSAPLSPGCRGRYSFFIYIYIYIYIFSYIYKVIFLNKQYAFSTHVYSDSMWHCITLCFSVDLCNFMIHEGSLCITCLSV